MATRAPGKRRKPRGRGVSRDLDREKIVAAALARVRREGLERLTMRGLAADLEVDPAAVYWHFDGKAELLDAVAAAAAVEVALPVPRGRSWRRRCESLCGAIRERLRDHPELESGQSSWLGPFNANANAALARELAAAGLRGDVLFFAAQGLLDTIAAVVRSEAALARAPVEDTRHYVGQIAAGLPEALTGDYRALIRRDARLSFESYFEAVIALFLDGVEARLAPEG